ncbi:uncharacterized protein EAF01_010125 [Botrytis porri]|uniref:uncharacterized protein n=1 Tax=Botrytis porri TaxID=87229 RepID=UPI00190177CC|nr:uncharacterized protein EAF01_010125 [Botrytis porri]KAF7894675.1 hypothetical protein EAF01_010125 [Botrytis porri]
MADAGDDVSTILSASFREVSVSTLPAKEKARLFTQNEKQHYQHHPNQECYHDKANIQPAKSSKQSERNKSDIMLQFKTRHISQKQLIVEARGLYAGLQMVAAKCIEVDEKLAILQGDSPVPEPLNDKQWNALNELHHTLIYAFYDLFQVLQHPSASLALQTLPSKHFLPGRMWRHAIHSFLEVLRARLPTSHDNMIAFMNSTYSMLGIFYETVPAFQDVWIECLGDLGRFRTAVAVDNTEDKQIWNSVARYWYSKASDRAPATGRLYHHLAILTYPNSDPLSGLYYYAKSLCVATPFTPTKESLVKFFHQVKSKQVQLPSFNTTFVLAHSYIFTYTNMEQFERTVEKFLSLLDSHIGQVTRKFMEEGYHISISNIIAAIGFGSGDNPVTKLMMHSSTHNTSEDYMGGTQNDLSQPTTAFRYAEYLNNSVLEIVLKRIGDLNVLPFVHVTLVYLHHISQFDNATALLALGFPWQLLNIMLNTLLCSYGTLECIEHNGFPSLKKNENDYVRPFPEDYAMRGLSWAEGLYPEEYFLDENVDEEEKCQELPSMLKQRQERILWLACRVAARVSPWLIFNSSKSEFTTEARSADLQSERTC